MGHGFLNRPRKELIRRRKTKQQKGKCPLCGESLVWWKATIDHIIPRSKGGTDAEWNLQAVHHDCNGRRGNADLPEDNRARKHAELCRAISHGQVGR